MDKNTGHWHRIGSFSSFFRLEFVILFSGLLVLWLWAAWAAPVSAQDPVCGDGQGPSFDPPDFYLTVDPASQTVEPGAVTSYLVGVNAINCYSGTITLSVSGLPEQVEYAFDPAVSVSPVDSTLMVTTTGDTLLGTYPLIVSGDSGELHHEAAAELVVNEPPAPNPDFGIAVSPASQSVDPGGEASYTVSLEALEGFTGTVTLAVSGLPTGTVATFDPETQVPPGDSALSIVVGADTPPGTYPLAVSGDSGELHHEAAAELVVNEPPAPNPDFGIAVSPASQSVDPGGEASYTVSLEALEGFTGTVTLAVSGLPTGTVATFDPETQVPPGDSALSIVVGADTPPGTYPLAVSGDSGELYHEAAAELVVNELVQQTTVSVSPASDSVFLGETAESQILLSDATNFYGVEFSLSYDPAVLQVVDADPDVEGVQIGLGDLFPADQYVVGVNQVYTDTGQVLLGVSRRSPALPVDGGGVLAVITWQAVAEGVSDLAFTHLKLSDPSGFELDALSQDGEMSVTMTGVVRGQVRLQGRSDHSGAEVVADPAGLQAITDVEGLFRFLIEGLLTITARMPGYLSAQATVKVTPGETVDLGTTVLHGGEVTGDDCIDILDLSYLGSRFHGDDLSADLNGDGLVDILDLSMAAANFTMCGPTVWGE